MPETFDTGPGPSRRAFFLAYACVVAAGFIGAVIGYGWGEIGCDGSCTTQVAVSMAFGAIISAVGAGVVAVLVLRAMAEWRRPQ
ncbi:MAG: hypothetical protein JJE46_05845 [Acidimicrobiia bacterium]|nr:hypothetical protein [Acidimicrobiia bacterium]